MKHGPAWVVFEEIFNPHSRELLSLLSIRQSKKIVKRYVEQLHIDRHRSIETKISYKKSRNSVHTCLMTDHYSNIIHCGDGPWIHAIPARSISFRNGVLSFTYKIAADKSDPFNPIFEDRTQTLSISAGSSADANSP